MKRILIFFATFSVIALLFGAISAWAQEAAPSEDVVSVESESGKQQDFTPETYDADSILQVGTVVQIDPADSRKVIPATQDKLSKAFGVVISRNNQPLQIVDTAQDGQVYIASSGRQSAMVTNENGPVEAGDFLIISSLSGTLTKSTPKQEMVFAKALTSFDGKNNTVGTTTLQDTEGRPHKQIGIGLIPVQIQIMKNPESEISTKANLPEQLQRIGQLIAEKEVSPIRIYLSMAIVALSIIVTLTVLYAGVRNAIIAIGRNPLSKKSIFWALLQVILTSILVLIIGLFAVYLLLRL